MKKVILHTLLIAFIAALALPVAAQVSGKSKIKDLKGCAYTGTLPKGVQVNLSAVPNDEAKRYIDTILLVGILTGGEILLRAADSVKNAIATEIEGKRYILYNPDFLRQFKQGGDARWKAYSVLAHEVGHHVSKHNFGETNCGERKKMEREADEYSGKVLRGLCSTREQSLEMLKALPSNQPAGSCYPSIVLRKKIVDQAWYAQDSIYKVLRRDPCVDTGDVRQLTYKVPESILNTNPMARIFNDRVEFTIDIPQTAKRKSVFTHIIVDEKAGKLTNIRSFVWKDFPLTPGFKKLEWKFKKDGFTREDLEKDGFRLLNICAFDKNPARTPKKELVGWGLMAGVGAGTLTWGCIRFDQSQALIKTYRQYKSPNDELYTKPGADSRSAINTKADNRLTQSVYAGLVGGTLLTWGLKKLIERGQRNKRTFIIIPNYLNQAAPLGN